MDPKLADELLKRLDLIGGKLELGVGTLWPTIIKRVYAEGALDLLLGLVLLFAAYKAFVAGKESLQKWQTEDRGIGLMCICGLCTFVGIFIFGHGWLEIFSPEYVAFRRLVEMFTKGS